MKLSRRNLLTGLGAVLVMKAANAAPYDSASLGRELARIEAEIDGRLGVAVHDTASGKRFGHRSDERFPMCSTFKVLACGAVLARVDRGEEDLSRQIRFDAADIVTYSPVTKNRIGGGMALAELMEAALTQSDNTAGNLILASINGPSSVTAYARALGDVVTRLDRNETGLNEAKPGDPRDTTTPSAMTANLEALVIGNALSNASRERLTAWLIANQTGGAKLRAGLPRDWRVGDKTGGGDWGTMSDVAVIWPTDRKPVIVSVYITGTKASFDDRNAAIAAIGSAVGAWVNA